MRDFTANDIAMSIINNQLDKQSLGQGQLQPDPYYIPTFPSEPVQVSPKFNVPPTDPWVLQQYMDQMYGVKRGGKT